MLAKECFEKLVEDFDFESVIDVGAGKGTHTEAFLNKGKLVTAVDLGKSHYFNEGKWASHPKLKFIQGEFDTVILEPHDCLWASHVLEHQRNPGQFLDRCFALLKDDGILAVTVPPLKHEIVGGHLTLWNTGLLLYNLILAGFDCSGASVRAVNYDISVIVRKKPVPDEVYDTLVYDWKDVSRLAPYFPSDSRLKFCDGFVGNTIPLIRW